MFRSTIWPALFALAAACSSAPPTDPPPKTGSTSAAAHAPPAAVPGSHEDWCDEHAVPESLCSRCNPSLVPAFKATHDWCEEHGLPESQCLACHPELKIVRPPAKEGG